jgi:two-component system sensor histidine kinase/response regulator
MSRDMRKVLLVDDEPLNLDVLESFLLGLECESTRAASGDEALQSVEHGSPDLVLLDIMMPGMDGFEVCRRLKGGEKTRFIPVVMVTSLDQKADRIEAIKAGADDFITKPVDKAELRARVKSLLRMKSFHDELEKSHKEILELQTMKDNLVYMLIHDFKNPLTGILGYLDLIGLQSETGCENCQQYAHNSQYLAKRMSSMVNDLMDIARLEKNVLPLRLDEVHLKDIVEDNLREFRHAIDEKSIKTVVEEGAEGVYVDADKTLLERVAGNILSNAIRYSEEYGNIIFKIDAAGGKAVLSISDEGPGIPEEALGRVFEKFYQVEANVSDARTGAGLGLAFCDMVIKAHGGHIEVKNNPVSGCTFTITLPAL